MNTYRKNAAIAGVLYIVGTVSGFLSLALSEPLRAGGDPLAAAAANANQVTVAALCVLLMGLALAMVPVVLYPVLKRHNEVLALGYVVFRGALEPVTCFVTAIAWLLLLAAGQLSVQSGAAAAGFQVPGALLLKASDVGALGGIVFCLGACMFYVVLYRSRLVPRWISGWGLVAVVPYLAAEFMALFGLLDATSSTAVFMFLPMAVQEMALAVWLIAKGFNASAVAPGAAKAVTDGLLSAA